MKKLFFILVILNGINHASEAGGYEELQKQPSLFKPLQTNVVINEIMADVNPSPSNLPAYEYIELYNRSSSPITLHKWTLSDAVSTATIPDILIQPDSFFVLTTSTGAAAFGNSIQVKGVSSFPSLNDTGDNLILRDSAGNIISLIFYTNSWYNDPIKNTGGWSLEQIDPNNTCAGKINWKASANNAGGTPGKRNSVNSIIEDKVAPFITHCSMIDSTHIQLFFSESADSITLAALNNYSIDKAMGNPIEADAIGPEYLSVILTLANPAAESIVYTVIASDIQDCKGNNGKSEIQFGKSVYVAPGEININEILFDPKTNGVEWVELYNRSNKIIDLKELSLCSYDETGMFSEINPVSSQSYLFFPDNYIVLSKDDASIKAQYETNNTRGFINMKDIPSLNNDSDWVIIINTSQTIIDKVHYNSNWHLSLLNDTKGISLERINPNNPSQGENNWHSASESCGFATPAYKNSQYINEESINELTISPEVFSPDNDGYNDILSISYSFNVAGMIGNIHIYDSQGSLIRSLVRNELLASNGIFFWDGFTDSKTKAGIGIYIIYFETFNKKGIVKKYKKACTIGGRL